MDKETSASSKDLQHRNYNPLIWGISIVAIVVILGTNYLPRSTTGTIGGVDLTVLPLLNAIFNGITFFLLLAALIMIMRKNVKAHRRFIYAAFATTFLFLISYLTYHSMAGSTSYGNDGVMQSVYYFILISHIILATAVVPLSLMTLSKGLSMQVAKHRKIARWTMPIWLYVSATGVIVYLMISPYY